MSKRVELTWRTKDGSEIVEPCWLVDDEDEIFIVGSGIPLTVITEDGVGNVVGTIAGDMVMFEDDFGLFGVPPNDVIYIREL